MTPELYASAIRIAARRVGQDEAVDVVHEAVEGLLRRYGPESVGNERLVRRAVVRQAIDFWRVHSRREHCQLVDHRAPEDVEETAILSLALDRALERFVSETSADWPVPCCLLLAAGYSAREIAAGMGVPLTTVKSRMWRERSTLRRLLREEGLG